MWSSSRRSVESVISNGTLFYDGVPKWAIARTGRRCFISSSGQHDTPRSLPWNAGDCRRTRSFDRFGVPTPRAARGRHDSNRIGLCRVSCGGRARTPAAPPNTPADREGRAPARPRTNRGMRPACPPPVPKPPPCAEKCQCRVGAHTRRDIAAPDLSRFTRLNRRARHRQAGPARCLRGSHGREAECPSSARLPADAASAGCLAARTEIAGGHTE